MDVFFYNSPFGILKIAIEKDAVVLLKFVDEFGINSIKNDFIKKTRTELDEYFWGTGKMFNLKLNPQGTAFQKKVWAELCKIPYGETKSYGEIAQNLGDKNLARAVGNACNKNPILIVVPCHRVVGKNGDLTGFAYGLELKEKLLQFEGKV